MNIASPAAFSLGVDLGGTKIMMGVGDSTGHVIAQALQPTDPRGGHHVVDQIHAMAVALAAGARMDLAAIRSVVVGAPGVVEPHSGAIGFAPNIEGFAAFDVRAAMCDRFGLDVAIENDVNLAALGEGRQGCAQGCDDYAFLALGTGVGLGLVAGGQMIRGAIGAAGEIAYLPLGQDIRSPEALKFGAFELEVGSLGMVRRYWALGGTGADSVREMFARLGVDPAAARALDEVADAVALAITAIHAIVDPAMVVLGGSIGMRPELVQRVQSAMTQVLARPVRIVASDLGNRAGLVGAICSASQRLWARSSS